MSDVSFDLMRNLCQTLKFYSNFHHVFLTDFFLSLYKTHRQKEKPKRLVVEVDLLVADIQNWQHVILLTTISESSFVVRSHPTSFFGRMQQTQLVCVVVICCNIEVQLTATVTIMTIPRQITTTRYNAMMIVLKRVP